MQITLQFFQTFVVLFRQSFPERVYKIRKQNDVRNQRTFLDVMRNNRLTVGSLGYKEARRGSCMYCTQTWIKESQGANMGLTGLVKHITT